jgi:PAS domain S-box-containing protein
MPDTEDFQNDPGSADAKVLLAAVVESSDDAIITKNLDGTITSWNRAAERIFGYKASEVVGGPISILIPPERGMEEGDILRRISRGERVEHFETVRLHKSGKRLDISVTISPLMREEKVVGASKIARDITPQRDVQYELERQRAYLEVTLSSIGDAVIVSDVNGAVTFMNPVAEALTGWRRAEATGQQLETVFHIVNEVTRHRAENPVVHALREGTVVGLANHTMLLAKNGVERAIDDSAAPIRAKTGEVLGIVLVFRDVSGIRTADEHRARLAAIVQSSEDAIISKDLTGRIMSWNAGATRLFGYSADEAVGRPISMLIPPDRLSEEPDILQRLRRGERVEHFETVRMTKDRRKVAVSLTISPIHGADGQIIGASKIVRDITDRTKTERELAEAREQLQNYSKELEATVAERTAELRDALEQLETFSYSISHDLRAPLRAMNGFVEVILSEHAKELNPEVSELLQRVARSGKRLSTLIEEVLNSTRLKLRPGDLRPVSLARLIPGIIEDYPNLRSHREAIDIKTPLLPVVGTEALLTQAISNVLGNSIKFGSRSRPLKIVVATERENDHVRLAIRDNGIGIIPAEQPRIFELFARGSTSRDVEGTGIGLAVVKRAIMRMGGEVGVESKPDVGSEFWFKLPAAADESGG